MTYLRALLTYRKLPFADKLRTLKKNKGHFIILELNSGIIKWPKRTTALRFYKILLVGEIWEKLEVCSVTSVIQTREPLLYDSIKILLVNENIVEIEVC